MIHSKKFSCMLCGGKIIKKRKNEIFAPGESIYLIPARACFFCKALHNLEGKIITQKGKVAFWEESERKVIFETIKKARETFQNISATL
jgi:hypothetical protein